MTGRDEQGDRDLAPSDDDAGAPGDHLPEPPLTDDERALLAELRRPAEGEPVAAVEDSAAMLEAVEDDSPLPAGTGTTDADVPAAADPDTPRFEAPGE